MAEKLTLVIRGNNTESIHWGSAVVATPEGEVRAECGDPSLPVYGRSCVKPVQVLPMVLSGAADRYGLSDREIAVCCGSHNGEPMHTETVSGMLKRGSLSSDKLNCGTHAPYSVEAYEALLRSGAQIEPIHNNCSGKHAGMLLTCLHLGLDPDTYTESGHLLQRQVRELLAELSGMEADKIEEGSDGCGLPTHLFPLERLALIFAKLADPSGLRPELQEAILRVRSAIVRHPEMIGGTDEFDTELIRRTQGKIIGKIGAEGVYALAIPELKLGAAVKVDDGNRRAAYPAAVELLRQVGALSASEFEELSEFRLPLQCNHRGEEAGRLEPVIELKRTSRFLTGAQPNG
ncbi:L-asparaginase [Saccharibacillus sp. O23]|uniref:asparaginase n=1 Tax=Saccharibacillus sp. O23 TaxID=2009338 RepID=UPI000B4E40F5|nr:asparaginase [Saccharibacillus sp. O23]OWR32417.1 L-asparaginase [Saccharibacillus sp. O23]